MHLEKLVDLADLDARTGGDALPARAIDKVGIAALGAGHGFDDRFLAGDDAVVDTRCVELILDLAHARQHAQDALHATQLLHLAKLRSQVVHVELTFLHFGGELFRLRLVDAFGGPFDQADDIAHVEDAAGNARREEGFQRFQLFARAQELDRCAGHEPHRQRRAATAIAIDARQDDAGNADRVVERFGDIDRVLAGQRIRHQQGFVRRNQFLHRRHFGHQLFIDMLAAGGIKDDGVIAADLGRRHGAAGDVERPLPGDDRQHGNAGLLAQHAQLLHSGRAGGVERRHQHALLLAGLQHQRQLGGCRGLARTLQADHQDRRGRRSQAQRGVLRTEHFDQHIVHDLDDLLGGRDRADDILADGARTHLVDEILHHRQRHVRLDQGGAHFGQRGIDIALAERAAPAKLVEYAAEARLQ